MQVQSRHILRLCHLEPAGVAEVAGQRLTDNSQTKERKTPAEFPEAWAAEGLEGLQMVAFPYQC